VQPRSRPPARAPQPKPRPRWPLAVAAVALVALAWALWPSAEIANRDSRGSGIVAFGDSLTAGVGATEGEDYPSRLSALIGQPVVNAGRSGDTTESAMERLDADVIALNPRIVIVGLGGNDFLRGDALASTEANLRTIVRKIQAGGAMVVLLGFQFPSLNADYGSMYERVADDEQCLLVKGVLSGILTDPALRSDQIHPNARGYALMAERMAGPLKKLVR
jgi:acyl-CoA thioesterase-1